MENVTGLWDDKKLYTRYHVALQFVNRVMGGIPQDPKVIEGWLRQRFTGGDVEIRRMMIETLEKLEVEVSDEWSDEQIYEAAKLVAKEQKGNTFFRDENGLYLSDYQVKAMLKENTNIVFAGEKWGKTRKGPKNFVAERVFPEVAPIYLGRMKPDGMHLQIGHVSGPQGPRSTLTYYDYVDSPSIEFNLDVIADSVEAEHWVKIFLSSQRNGLGALRSLGNGQFKVVAFDKVA